MTDIKINVSAALDSSGITAGMEKIRSEAERPIKIGIDNQDAIKNIKEVSKEQEAARTNASGTASASSTGETPSEIIRKREARQLKEYNEELRKHFNLKREVTELEYKSYQASVSRMARSGSAHGVYAAAANGDPNSLAGMSPDAFRHAVERTGVISTGSGRGVSSGMRGAFGAHGSKLASGLAGMAGGAMLGGSGGDGAATAGGAVGGMLGSIGGPVGSMVGAMLGSMVGGAVGGSMGSAKDEAIGITDLRHSIGSTTTDFALLRDSMRAAASGMGMTSLEAAKLARTFAHNSSMRPGDAGSLASEVRIASSISRSLGIDPSMGVSTMSALRNTQVTGSEADSRRMAMIIAGAISKNGMGSKGDEVLSAIANFAQTAARASLTAPNASGYTDFLGRMVGMKTPGLDVSGTASLMAKMDGSVRSHGDVATDNLKLAALQNAFPGMNANDMQLLLSGGSMGTARSVLKDLSGDKGARGARAQGMLDRGLNLDRPMQDILMNKLDREFGGDVATHELSGARVFGLEQNEFRKFNKAWHQGGGSSGIEKQLRGYGVDASSIDPTKYMHMGSLLGSNGSELQSEAAKLLSGKGYDKKLSSAEAAYIGRLSKSDLSKDDNVKELREAIISANKDRNQIDEGAQARQGVADVQQAIINMSGALLPAVNGVRDAVLMVGGSDRNKLAATQKDWVLASKYADIEAEGEKLYSRKGLDPAGNHDQREAYIAREKKAASDKYDKELNGGGGVSGNSASSGMSGPILDSFAAIRRGDFAGAAAIRAGKNSTLSNSSGLDGMVTGDSEYDAIFKEAAAKHGVDWRDLKQLAVQESGLKNNAHNQNKNGTIDRGLMQLNSKYDRSRGVTDPYDPRQNINAGAGVWSDALIAAHGDKREAFRRYNGSGSKAETYADNAMNLNRKVHQGDHTVTLIVKSHDNSFQPVRHKLRVTGKPVASGTGVGG